jgi:formyl-CoA transferase
MIADYDHPVVGRYRGLGVPFRMSATPLDGRRRPSPSFAAGTDPILAELGFDAPAREALVRSGAVVAARPPTTPTTAPDADRRTP